MRNVDLQCIILISFGGKKGQVYLCVLEKKLTFVHFPHSVSCDVRLLHGLSLQVPTFEILRHLKSDDAAGKNKRR